MPQIIQSSRIFPKVRINYGHEIYAGDEGRHIQEDRFDQISGAQTARIRIPMFEDVELNFVQENELGQWIYLGNDDRLGKVEWDDMALIHNGFTNLKQRWGDNVELLGSSDKLMRINAGNLFESSFLLLGNLWQGLEAELGHGMYAAIPNNSTLILAAEDNFKAVLELQKVVKAIFQSPSSGQLLSKAIYRRSDGEWKIVASAF